MRWLALLCVCLVFTALLFAQTGRTFPPPKAEPPTEEEAGLIKSRTKDLASAVAKLRQRGVTDPNAADVEVFLRAARQIVKHNEFYKGGAKQTLAVLDMGLLRADQQSRGRAPWLTAPAGLTVVRAYRSRIDGTLQPYAVSYPADYGTDSKKRYRLDVVLHGRNAGLTEVGFIAAHNAKKTPADLDFVQLDVYGRGNNAYRWAGETDIIEATENLIAVERLANRGNILESARPVLRGFSMGGAGTWHVGLHRPDHFCVLGPGAGFTTTRGYVDLPKKLPAYQESCFRIYDAMDYAENVFDVPVVAYSGADDEQKAAADNVENRLKKIGIDQFKGKWQHIIAPKTGHSIPAEYKKKLAAEYTKLANEDRDDYPKKVIFVTYTMRYPACNWVEIFGLEKHYSEARVEAEAKQDASTFVVKTANVRALRLGLWASADRGALTIDIDGKKLEGVKPYQTRLGDLHVYLEKRDGKWSSVLPERLVMDRLRNPQKIPGLQGPIDDAFMSAFLCVRGTGDPYHPRTADYAEADLARFTKEWAKHFRGELPVKNDTDVTAEEIASRHLILFGDPSSNSLIKEILPRLPLKWTSRTLSFGGEDYRSATHLPAMIFPSPLSTDHYVVLNSGHTFHEADFLGTNALLYPRLGDYAILKMTDPEKNGPLSSEVQTAGLFDEFWRVPGGGK